MSQLMSPVEAAVVRKAAWRLIPFLGLLFFVAFLDRVNVSYAALTMNKDIGLSASAYGLGAGIFFLGYFLFEVPSNLILHKVGARVWIARIMLTWGILSGATAFVSGPVSFYILRFLLGVAEAGFFPGMILYLTYWFPGSVRGRIISAFLLAIPLSSIIGAPVSTALLGTSIFGLHGWQTMFLIEALPAIVLAAVVFLRMTDRPAKATWLSPDERDTLETLLSREQHERSHVSGLRAGLLSPRVWLFAAIYLTLVLGLYGLNFWAPQIIKGFGGLSNQQVGLVTMVPYLCAAVGMFLWGRHSDAKRERVWHVSLAALLGAGGFLMSGLVDDPLLSLAALTIGAVGIMGALSVFWTLPTTALAGVAAAGGIAVINSVGNLGGYLGPYLMGWLKDWTGAYSAGLFVLAAVLLLGGLLVHAARPNSPDRLAEDAA